MARKLGGLTLNPVPRLHHANCVLHFFVCVCAVAIGKLQQLKKLNLSGSGMSNRNPLQQPGLVIT